MFCKNCGTKLDEGTKFCGACGAAMDAPAVPQVKGFKETVVVEISKHREQDTIRRYQCFA